jgi:GntR family transcriptional regulator/MocR family aminotransferase
MDFQITLTDRRDLSRQIYRQMRAAILGGRLRAGERLPSTRSLAQQAAVARKTVTRAYDLLFSESLVTGTPGSGTFVAAGVAGGNPGRPRAASGLRPRAVWNGMAGARGPAADRAAHAFDFQVGLPDISQFPFGLWRSLLASSGRAVGELDARYGDSQGDARLREAIARYVAFTRGVVCDAGQIVVTHGAQQAFDLIARVLLNPGETAAAEEPGYPPVRQVWVTQGIQVKPVPVDAEGLCVGKLPQNARLIYVTPSHQFPLGMPMSLERKLALLRWAAEHNACVLEDDYDSEFRFDPRPLEALQSLDRSGRVVYVGTFSKVLHPGIRIGFMVAPKSLVPALSAARMLTGWHAPLVTQSALARFITEGHLARHVRRMSRLYRRRRDVLIETLGKWREIFGEPVPSVAGLHIACLVEDRVRLHAILGSAAAEGARFAAISRLSAAPGSPGGFVLGYGRISEERIAGALQNVARRIGAGAVRARS